jgi:hypothetical protein
VTFGAAAPYIRRMKRLAPVLLVMALAAGCGSGMNLAGTKLTLRAVNPNVGQAVFHLDCRPAGGDVSDPAAACAALERDSKLVTSPQPFTCIGGPSSWFDITISGRLAGKPVHRKFSTCWTPQMATLRKLGLANSLRRHVLPRRHGVVQPGIRGTFPPGTLRPGDILVCTILHHRVQMGIPDTFGSIGSTGVGGRDIVSVTLTGSRGADGSVTASCHHGSS